MTDPLATATAVIAAHVAGRRLFSTPPEITGESHLADDLRFDSLDRVSIAMDLEEELEMIVPDSATATWHTVADVARAIAALQGEGA